MCLTHCVTITDTDLMHILVMTSCYVSSYTTKWAILYTRSLLTLKINWIRDKFSNIQRNIIDSNSRYYIIVWVRLIHPINQSKARSIPNTFCTLLLHIYIVLAIYIHLYESYYKYDARQFSPIFHYICGGVEVIHPPASVPEHKELWTTKSEEIIRLVFRVFWNLWFQCCQ